MLQQIVFFSFLSQCPTEVPFSQTGWYHYPTRFAQSNDQDEVVCAESIYANDLIQTYQVRISIEPHMEISIFFLCTIEGEPRRSSKVVAL
jgi:hypothetical protein